MFGLLLFAALSCAIVARPKTVNAVLDKISVRIKQIRANVVTRRATAATATNQLTVHPKQPPIA